MNAAGARTKKGSVGIPNPGDDAGHERNQALTQLRQAEDDEDHNRDDGRRFDTAGEAEGDAAEEDATARLREAVTVEDEREAGDAEEVHDRLEEAAAHRVYLRGIERHHAARDDRGGRARDAGSLCR